MADGFLGRGWGFPVRLDAGGQIALAPSGADGIRQSIWMILSTAPGERVMRPDFGCGVDDLVFGVQRPGTAGAVAAAARAALSTWEPRIDVLDVTGHTDPGQPNLLQLEITYQVRSTNSRYNLVFPFYLE